jgi:hypothetical protein
MTGSNNVKNSKALNSGHLRQKLQRAGTVITNRLLEGVHVTPGKNLPETASTPDSNTSISPFSMPEKLIIDTRISRFRPPCTLRCIAYTPVFRRIHAPIANIRPILRRRFAKQGEHLPAVSPRCLEPQEAHCSMKLPRCVMRSCLCFGPPLHVARGASSGGRLGGRSQRHLCLHNLQPSKSLTFKEPSNDLG